MYCIDTEALVFMFNGGSSYKKKLCAGYTNHINNERYMHRGFLAPKAYLCSTSLQAFKVCTDFWADFSETIHPIFTWLCQFFAI